MTQQDRLTTSKTEFEMATENFTNPLIQANAHETAGRLLVVLKFLANATLSGAVNDEDGKFGCSLIVDMCADAAEFITQNTDPFSKPA